MSQGRTDFGATRLRDGRVLSAGGEDVLNTVAYSTAELFDAQAGSVTATGALHEARAQGILVPVGGGALLVAGHVDGSPASSAAWIVFRHDLDGRHFARQQCSNFLVARPEDVATEQLHRILRLQDAGSGRAG